MEVISMDIKIQPYNSIWRPAIRMSKGKAEQEKILGKFAHYIANIYRDELVKAINTQRYSGRWEPLTPDYLAWKRAQGMSTYIWECTSLLKDSISVWRSGKSWVVGVNRRIRYPESEVPVYRVVRWMEFGTSKMPARPLFGPTKRLIQGRMRKYWTRFLQENNIEL